ncbi:MAG: GIY-YIG nuclease family protein [Candidatus Liptonbacteria bacterium]|nr:GIY-YIG nuclease family protein [Candidatus Liptonbacteria bacterium]
MPNITRIQVNKLPTKPGVYFMRDAKKRLLYIGKAVNLKRRVASYFQRPQESRLEHMVKQIARIEYRLTDTAIEALILEAELIKKLQPPYNILERDDKSFLRVVITKEDFPRVLLVREKELIARDNKSNRSNKSHVPLLASFGPFTSGSAIRAALRILRRIFPYSLHPTPYSLHPARHCFDHQIGLCPGTCIGAISKTEYRKTIRSLIRFFRGKKKVITREYEREMKIAARRLDFERAAELRRKVFALRHIQDVAVIKDEVSSQKSKVKSSYRIEGYDISNISGMSAVGSMVVFENGEPAKNKYRKFRIRTVRGSNDVAMLREVILRRLRHTEWPDPDLILVDGGLAQVNAARAALKHLGKQIPVVGLAKGPERKRTDIYGAIPAGTDKQTLIRIRDEAHRFAISYHRKLRGRSFLRLTPD